MDWSDKTVLVTGGTGSFGKCFLDVVLAERPPKRLIVFSRDELKQHELQRKHDHPSLRYFIGDIRDRERLDRAMRGVDIVVHSAALKQVPACEYNPYEAVKTNVLGSQNVVDAAIDAGVDRVIALSTDKAVNPVNLYGATKLCAEKLIVQGNSYAGLNGTRLACVRYGNVFGSRGSVVPLFRKQRDSGRLTVTDERMTRFWIRLPDGVRFVLSCIDSMRGGEIFVPKIPSMKIVDLAAAIAPDAEIDAVGIRPGEKLHETLISVDEARQTVDVGDYYIVEPLHPWWTTNKSWGGEHLSEGFEYSSESNEIWLDSLSLGKMLGEEP